MKTPSRRTSWKPLLGFMALVFTLPVAAQPEPVCAPIPDAQNGTAYPVSPYNCASYTGPFNSPAIFFAAHPDDETLGMAGSISQAVAAGRTVVVELMTRGTGSGAYNSLCAESTVSNTSHAISCDGSVQEYVSHGPRSAGPLRCDSTAAGRSTFGDARVREFMDSMRRLGVHAIAIHDYPDGSLTASAVTTRARFWTSRGLPGLTLTGTAGNEDVRQHPDHAAVHDGITLTGHVPRAFLSVYAGAICSPSSRAADPRWRRVIALDANACNAKKYGLAAYKVWGPAAGRYAVGWVHSTGDLFASFSNDCNEYVTEEGTSTSTAGNPFVYASAREQYLACNGIASRTASHCSTIADTNDRQLCAGMATSSQSPCSSMTDRNLQLACYGMSVAPNYPSNCRDITDPQLRAFCFGVASGGSYPDCANLTSPDTRALCQGMSLGSSSSCGAITDSNLRSFCYAVVLRASSYCSGISY